MTITWYGEACFKIQAKEATILTDPVAKDSGLTPARFTYDLEIRTLNSAPPPYERGSPFLVVAGPGEYEVRGIGIEGWRTSANVEQIGAAYVVTTEEVRLALLGHLTTPLEGAALEPLTNIDIAFIPAGGTPYLTATQTAALVKKINPKIVVPMLYKIAGLKRKTDDAKAFIKEVGAEHETSDKLTIKKKGLPTKLKIVALG